MPCDLLPCCKPHIVILRKVLHDVLQRDKSTGAADPAGMKGDSDVRGPTFQSLFAYDTDNMSLGRSNKTHSKALMHRWENASSEPSCPSQYLKSF